MNALVAAATLRPDRLEGPVAVLVEGGRVVGIWPAATPDAVRRALPAVEVTDVRPDLLAPGFIDLHVHGFRGYDLTGCTEEDVRAMAAALPETGATAFFATIASSSPEAAVEQVRRIRAAIDTGVQPGAEILGIRLEGPFISRAKRGAQPPEAIRPPDPGELRRIAAEAGGFIRAIDFAPELEGAMALLDTALDLGLMPVVGHTTASYDQARAAIERGARHCTHLFNAMPPLLHRDPGCAGAFLTDPRPSVEMIADGIHLHPAVLKLVLAAKGPGRTALVTDAIHASGLEEGVYEFAGRPIRVRDGAVRLEDGTLAGSTLTLDRAVRNLVDLAGASLEDSVRMASETPAAIAGLLPERGRIEVGGWADLVRISSSGRVRATWTRGQIAYVEEQPK